MTRCNAKNKQDLEEARSRNCKLEEEVADVRGQLAEAQLPPAPTPGSAATGPGADKQRLALREQCTLLDARLHEVRAILCVLEHTRVPSRAHGLVLRCILHRVQTN
jgi:hypothetical protein